MQARQSHRATWTSDSLPPSFFSTSGPDVCDFAAALHGPDEIDRLPLRCTILCTTQM